MSSHKYIHTRYKKVLYLYIYTRDFTNHCPTAVQPFFQTPKLFSLLFLFSSENEPRVRRKLCSQTTHTHLMRYRRSSRKKASVILARARVDFSSSRARGEKTLTPVRAKLIDLAAARHTDINFARSEAKKKKN